jgi:hypothetical protein
MCQSRANAGRAGPSELFVARRSLGFETCPPSTPRDLAGPACRLDLNTNAHSRNQDADLPTKHRRHLSAATDRAGRLRQRLCCRSSARRPLRIRPLAHGGESKLRGDQGLKLLGFAAGPHDQPAGQGCGRQPNCLA